MPTSTLLLLYGKLSAVCKCRAFSEFCEDGSAVESMVGWYDGDRPANCTLDGGELERYCCECRVCPEVAAKLKEESNVQSADCCELARGGAMDGENADGPWQ